MHGTIGAISAPSVTELSSVTSVTEQLSALPTFKARWWHRADRLDARPVIWSLRNRPEEWTWVLFADGTNSGRRIVHVPSAHQFWVATRGFYRLERANCGCNDAGGRFQLFQQGAFHRAFIRWRHDHPPQQPPVIAIDHDHFAAHFVR